MLDFIPRICHGLPVLGSLERMYSRRFFKRNGHALNYENGWWTPPLSPIEALHLETRQIEQLGFAPMVSLSDHDTIDGVWGLRSMESTRDTLVSVEWTVPFGDTFFHLGVHQLPAAEAHAAMAQLAAFTDDPRPQLLPHLLEWLNGWPGTLVVFNHPLWDESEIGAAAHQANMRRFLHEHKRYLHALELNGMRPWRENKAVTRLALEEGMPLISGGDRHGMEPNANINLTRASSFSEFVHEIRVERSSDVLFLPQYQHPLAQRVIDTICDVMRTNPAHAHGWSRWTDRVFWRERNGTVKPLSAYWEHQGMPTLVKCFASLIRTLQSKHFRNAMRAAFGAREELAW